jgi:hypothetical protein
MAGEIPVAIAEAARLAMAILTHQKEAKQDKKEGRHELATRKRELLQAANDAWDRGDLSACADFLAGVQNDTPKPDNG